MKNEKDILKKLIDKYDRSVLSKQGSERNLRIRFVMEKEIPGYYDFENYAAAEKTDEGLILLERKGWITLERRDSYIVSVMLNQEHVPDICRFLGITSDREKDVVYRRLFEQYRNSSLDPYVNDVLNRIDAYRSYSSLVYHDIHKTEDMLRGLAAIMELTNEVPQRVFSASVFGNSKRFEELSAKTAFVLKTYFSAEDEEEEDVLAGFNIIKNPSRVCIKGHGVFWIGDSQIHLKDFRDGFMLASEDIRKIRNLFIPEPTVLTVENLTPFYQMNSEDQMIIYLGGYHNHVRSELLRSIYSTYPELHFYHFGDLDAGGFSILEHLKRKTGIPFQPYMMDLKTLKKYEDKAIPLKSNDADRLQILRCISEYSEVIDYMLDRNIKLEQENIQL